MKLFLFEVLKERRAGLLIFLFFRYFSETKGQEIALLALRITPPAWGDGVTRFPEIRLSASGYYYQN
jgi:hypothetical protein